MPKSNETNNISPVDILNDLKAQLKENYVSYEGFSECYKKIEELRKEYLSLLDWAHQLKRDDKIYIAC